MPMTTPSGASWLDAYVYTTGATVSPTMYYSYTVIEEPPPPNPWKAKTKSVIGKEAYAKLPDRRTNK